MIIAENADSLGDRTMSSVSEGYILALSLLARHSLYLNNETIFVSVVLLEGGGKFNLGARSFFAHNISVAVMVSSMYHTKSG